MDENAPLGGCRRSAGTQSVAWVILPLVGYHLTRGTPASYRSSPSVTRTFCGCCGTTLTYQHADAPKRIDITIGSLDDPSAFVPTEAVFTGDKVSWASPI